MTYSNSVLDALDIVNGPGHMEVKMVTQGNTPGPCLVEVGSRCHGGEGTWSSIADECVGYNQIGCSFDAFVNPDNFDALPMVPETLLKSGREVSSGEVHHCPPLPTTVHHCPPVVTLAVYNPP